MAEKFVKLDDVIDTLENEWGYDGMREDLQNLPAADVVEVRYGEWVSVDGTPSCGEWECTACGQRKSFLCKMDEDDLREDYQYCPRCGAKMDGGAGNG